MPGELITGLKYLYLLNVYLNASRTVQRYVDRGFLLIWALSCVSEVNGKSLIDCKMLMVIHVSCTFLNGIAWRDKKPSSLTGSWFIKC